jgi:hypothetical protein
LKLDREIEVRVCKDRIIIVKENHYDFFDKGGTVSSEKKSVNIGKPPLERPINYFISRKTTTRDP